MKQTFLALIFIATSPLLAHAEEPTDATETLAAVDAVVTPSISAMWLLFRDQGYGATFSDSKICLTIGKFNQAVFVAKLTGGLNKLAGQYPGMDINSTIASAKKAEEKCR